MVESDSDRRMAAAEKRLDYLDEHGSRGVVAVLAILQTQITQVMQNIAKEGQDAMRRFQDVDDEIEKLQSELSKVRAVKWSTVAAYTVAIIPVYAAVAFQITFQMNR